MWKETGDGVRLGRLKKIIIIVQKLLKLQIGILEWRRRHCWNLIDRIGKEKREQERERGRLGR